MSELSKGARALLASAKAEPSVDRAALARVRRNVLGRVGASAAVATGAALATKAAVTPTAPVVSAWLLVAKVFGSLAVVSVVAAFGVVLERGSPAAVPQAAPATPSLPTALPPPVAEVPVGPIVAIEVKKTPPRDTRSLSPRHNPVVPAIRGSESAWALDMTLLRDAQASLVAGDPRRARELAERVAQNGPFATERDALIAIAECRSAAGASMEAARRRAVSFVEAHEATPLANRVQVACSTTTSTKP